MSNHPPRRRVAPVLVAFLTALLGFVAPAARSQPVVLVDSQSLWRLFKGTSEPSPSDRSAWRQAGFNDAPWEEAPAPLGYGEPALLGDRGTVLTDMQNGYPTLFLRRTFTLANPDVLEAVELQAICDDGFIAWINGRRVASLNAPSGEPSATSLAGGNAQEPVAWTPYPLPDALQALVPGENVLAVQVFNTSLGSSDLVFDARLTGVPRPSAAPVIAQVQPTPGPLDQLGRITVTFSEPVRGVTAEDFLVNGVSAERVEGNGATYTFRFTQPPFGPVEIRWGTLHAIEDYESPPNRFEIAAEGSVWRYELIDPLGPVVATRQPPPGATVPGLPHVLVTFDKAVIGVDAADLLRNGVAATNVAGIGAGPYLFEFPPAPAGIATFTFTTQHGILSDTLQPRPLTPSTWSCSVQPGFQDPALRITEFMAENFTSLRDEDQDPEDWIEIHNPTASSVNLEGWSLSRERDDPEQWVFPAVQIPAGGYRVIHASGKDRRPTTATGRLHTNFKLNPNGGYLALHSPALPRRAVSMVEYPEQGPNHSYGRENNTGDWRYFLTGTPGTANGSSPIRSTVASVRFSVPRGFFTGPFQLTLSCPTPGALIRFTTNGSPPSLTDGFTYTNAIPINLSRVIRAAAFLTNALPSRVLTHTYLVNQTATRLRIPALSLVTATNNLYGRTGIMEVSPRNTTKRGAAWERPVSAEWILPTGEDGFQVDCGLRVQGGDYVRGQYNYRSSQLPFSKYSFRLYFRGEYGQGRLNYPLFPETTQTSFDTIVLRAGMNDHSNPYLTDEFVRSLVRDTGQPSPAGTFVHLFLNGVYRGYYNPCERIDVDFLRAYHGGGEKWDLMAQFGEVREGDATAFNTLRTLASTRDLTLPANYRDITARLDVTNFVDYLLPLIYVDNDDWPHNNWRAARERVPGGLFRMVCWDAEWAFGLVNGHAPSWDTIRNQLSTTSPPWGGSDIQRIFIGLRKSPEFRQLVADRVHRHFFNDGVLTDDRLRARYASVTNRLAGIVSGFNNRIGTTWIPQRRRNVLLHLDRAGFLASSNAPAFSRFGGTVGAGERLVLTNLTGPIYYTTNGSDPRIAFTGAVAAEAMPYSSPIRIQDSVQIRARSLSGTNWSAITEASFQVRRLGVAIAISEIMYHPPGGEAFEYLELHNHGDLPLDLTGYSFRGISFRFPDPSPLMPPGARWVLANDARPGDFAARYPEVTVAGWFGGALNNGGERLELLDPSGRLVTAVEFGSNAPWPQEADGAGASLEFLDPESDPHDPAAWAASLVSGGTPGSPPPSFTAPSVRLSEISAVPAPAPDWIELFNAGPAPVSLEGWSLSDNQDPRRFVFPAGTVLASGGYLQVWCDTNASAALHAGFALSARGETLALYNASGRRVDAVTFGPIPDGFSLGRLGEGSVWELTEPTPLAHNESAPLASPSQVTVNEWLANPSPGQDDWIEFHNLSPTQPVALRGLYIGTSNALTRIRIPSFVGPSGFVVLTADGNPGPDHLDLTLPGNAGAIVVSDPQGTELQRLTYRVPMEGHPSGAQDITLGRLPDGSGSVVAFPGTASPGAPNYVSPMTGPRFSEFMAANRSAIRDASGVAVDWLELHNPSATAYDLSGCSLSVGAKSPGEWTFPAGVRLAPQAYLVIWCSSTRPPSTSSSPPMQLGRGLPDEGATLWLFDANRRVLDSVVYGQQLQDLSSGRTPQGTWSLLASPTPAAANAAGADLASPSSLRINEWLAGGQEGEDWIEIHNPESIPAELGGSFLTDDPSVSGLTRFQVPPLTWVPARGHLVWRARGAAANQPDELPFGLDPLGETLRLYAPNRSLVDSISYEPQRPQVSSGRFPDGADRLETFPGSESPGSANWRFHPGLVISEVLTHTDPPFEDAIELHNASAHPITLDGWWLSPSDDDLRRVLLPNGIVLPPGGYRVLYEREFNAPSEPKPFTLNSAHGDEVWVSETDASGQPTGYRAHVRFGAAANGVSFGRYRTSVGWDFPPLSRPTFGVDRPQSPEEFRLGQGLPNAYPLVGPVVITEIHATPYSNAGAAQTELPQDEFIEIHNAGLTAQPLFDPNAPTNTWHLRGGIQFDFPPGVTLPAQGFAVVVPFDPTAPYAAEFRTRRNVPPQVNLYGPFTGRLADEGEEVRLERPDRPQGPPAPDAGFVPYLLVERVAYLSGPTWPTTSSDSETAETSLQRRRTAEYGNDPVNWIAGPPTPGTRTQPPLTDPDFDGIPTDWELAFGLNPSDPGDADLDSDGDGLTHRAEYLAGTDPRDPASALRVRLSVEPSTGLVLRFRAVAQRSYSVMVRDGAAFGEWRKLLDVGTESFDREAAIPVGIPVQTSAFLQVVTPAFP